MDLSGSAGTVWDVLQWAALKGSANKEIQRSPTIKKTEISTGDR
jgi:hypothetical protein